MLDTGLPGRPKYGTPPTVQKTSGLPGFMATRQKIVSAPKSSRTFLTKSYSPTETPPEETAKVSADRGLNGGADCGLVVRYCGQHHWFGSVGVAEGGESARIAVDNLAFSGRLLNFDQLVAGREDGDARPAIDRDEALLHGGEHGQFAGTALGTGLDDLLAAAHVLAAPANVRAALFNGEDLDPLPGRSGCPLLGRWCRLRRARPRPS